MDSHTMSLGASSLMDWMQASSLPSMAFFSLIKDHLDEMIRVFQGNLLSRVGKLIGAFAATVMTFWIIIQGFRIVTGQSREPMMALVVNSLRSVVIVGVALSAAVTADTSYDALTDGLSKVIREVVTGRQDDGPYADMDKVLGVLQVGMELVGSIDVGGDQMTNDTKDKTMTMLGVGLGGPVIMAMIAMMLNKIAMALFIGFGPFFILCLLFDQTKALFQKWLFYGIATMMTMGVLITMTTIAIDLTLAVGMAFWAPSMIPGLGTNTESLMSMALQQGGLGMVLSALIITAPPMAGAFFNGVAGSYFGTNNFTGSEFKPGGGNPAGNGYPPGSPGYSPTPANQRRPDASSEVNTRPY